MIATPVPTADSWVERRRRALELAETQSHAREMLALTAALAEVQGEIHASALSARPEPAAVAAFVADEALAGVIAAAVAAGPGALASAASAHAAGGGLEAMVQAWLDGDELSAPATFLARAAATPVLMALEAPPRGRGEKAGGCPRCGGLPQLAYLGLSSEALVTGQRHLLCSRCEGSWVYPRMVCAVCGEADASRLPIYADRQRFPNVRADGCTTCRRFLLTVDLPRDPRAVPVVDEIAALPLDLYARERGLQKVTPNLMGF